MTVRIVNIGMNHESAPVELRECMANNRESSSLALSCMRESEWIKEGLFLSTCNRVEAIYTTDYPEEARKTILSMISRVGNISEERFKPNIYIYEDSEALKHVFRVASSLDSMVVGEPQILGQIKEAYHQAAGVEKTTGVILNRLMHRAFHVAKKVKTETGISEAAVSISYAAVELAKKIYYSLEGKKVLLVGAGEMAELAARHLMGNGIESLIVANRSFDKAVQIADLFRGKAVFFEEMEAYLLEVDIVVTSTSSMDFVIPYDMVRNSLRKRRNHPLFFIDIAVPRDVDPRVNKLENVYLYDIDDLKEVVNENTAQRKEEAIKAERIVQEEVIRFEKWLKTLDVVPTITALKDKIESIRKSEIEKSLPALGDLTPSQIRAIDSLTESLTGKIMNDPIVVLKGKADGRSRDIYLDVTRKLFSLDKDDKNA
jgi:glutamyl-tRNA reductase